MTDEGNDAAGNEEIAKIESAIGELLVQVRQRSKLNLHSRLATFRVKHVAFLLTVLTQFSHENPDDAYLAKIRLH